MNKVSPVEMRKALEVVELFKTNGIQFVAMPVIDNDDYNDLIKQASKRLEYLEYLAE